LSRFILPAMAVRTLPVTAETSAAMAAASVLQQKFRQRSACFVRTGRLPFKLYLITRK